MTPSSVLLRYLGSAPGQLQRRKIATRPADGDEAAPEQGADGLQALADEGMTLMMVTHEMNFARKVADRAIFIDDGSIVEQGDPEMILTAPKTERLSRFLNTIFWGEGRVAAQPEETGIGEQ